MTDDQFIHSAKQHAKDLGIPIEKYLLIKARHAVIVTFRSASSLAGAKVYLDAETGETLNIEVSDPEYVPQTKGAQFSKRARQALALANQESRRMSCEHVSSDHLLLGIVAFGEGAGAEELKRAGLTLETLRARLVEVGSPPEVAPTGYGPSMRNVLRLCSEHARALGSAEIEPEHLTLGLLEEGDGPAMRLMRHFRVNPEELKFRLVEKLRGGSKD